MRETVYKAKYLSPTDYKGARIKITNLDNLESKIIPYDYRFNNAKEIAIHYINSMGVRKVINTFWDDSTSYVYLITEKNNE